MEEQEDAPHLLGPGQPGPQYIAEIKLDTNIYYYG
jgi:hypothetical protein